MILFNDEHYGKKRTVILDEEDVSYAVSGEDTEGEYTAVFMKHCVDEDKILMIHLPGEEVCQRISDQCLNNFMMKNRISIVENISETHTFPHDEGGNDDHETRI